MIQRALQALRDVPHLVRIQTSDPFLGKVRRALCSQRGASEQKDLTDTDMNRCLIDDQSLLWLEIELSGALVGRTAVLAIPSCLVSDMLALIQC